MKTVVSLNSGSSSIKFAVFRLDETGTPTLSASGKFERIGIAPSLLIRTIHKEVLLKRDWGSAGRALSHADLLSFLFDWASDHVSDSEIVAIGHRVVHGGTSFMKPCLIDEDVLGRLDALSSLAPLHQPHNLMAIRSLRELAPHLPQVACFDTAFHHAMPEIATRFALPRTLHEAGVRRYGFHGLSYEYVARTLARVEPALAAGRVIAAHLGNGASLCAMKAGISTDTTMGFTALDGLMMGTRCGTLDPGIVLHLQTAMGMDPDAIQDLLYSRSGLLGVSALSSDMRTLSGSLDPHAEEALALYAFRAARETGALVSSLGGLDGLVFTAGIGENDAAMRARICARLEWLGLSLDAEANAVHAPVISSPQSRVRVRIIPTDEERMIALHTLKLVKGKNP